MTIMVIWKRKGATSGYYFSLAGITMGRLSVKRFKKIKKKYPHCFVKPSQEGELMEFWTLENF